MRKHFVSLTVVAALAVGIFGWRKFSANVLAIRDVASDQLDDLKGQAVRAAEIRVLLQDFGKSVDEYGARAADIDEQAQDAERELVQLRGESDNKLAVLKQAKHLLENGQVQFVIGGRTWTRDQVTDDAMKRAAEYQRLQASIEGKEKALTQLRDGAAEAKANLEKAKVAQSQLNDELAGLETRLENAQMLASVRQMMSSVSVPNFGPSSELRSAMDRLRRQVRHAEIAASGTPGESRPAIDYVNHSHEAIDVLTSVINGADRKALAAAPATRPAEASETAQVP